MKKVLLFSIVLVAAGSTILLSCKKKKYDNSDASKLNAIAENSFEEMTNMSDQAMTGNMVYYKSEKVTVLFTYGSTTKRTTTRVSPQRP